MSEHLGPEPPEDDDGLLDALGALAREQEQGLPGAAALEALARGEVGVDDEAFAGAEDDPATAALLAALAAPPSADFAGAALAAFAAEDGAEGEARGVAPPAATPAAPDNVVPFPRRSRRMFVLGGVALAAAAAVAVFALRPQAPPLPGYAASVTGGQHVVRGDAPPAVPALGPDDRLKIVLTPAAAIDGPIAVRGFVMGSAGARPWQPPAEVSPDGAVRVAGTGRALGLAPAGEGPEAVVLRLFVGRPDALPSQANADASAERARVDVAVQLTR